MEEKEEVKKKTNVKLIVLIAALAVVLSGAAGFITWKIMNDGNNKNTAANVNTPAINTVKRSAKNKTKLNGKYTILNNINMATCINIATSIMNCKLV